MLLYFLIDDISCRDCEIFVAAYVEFLSDGIEVPSCGISVDTLRLRYASLLWNYGIVKAQNGYVSDNEDPEMRRTKKKLRSMKMLCLQPLIR